MKEETRSSSSNRVPVTESIKPQYSVPLLKQCFVHGKRISHPQRLEIGIAEPKQHRRLEQRKNESPHISPTSLHVKSESKGACKIEMQDNGEQIEIETVQIRSPTRPFAPNRLKCKTMYTDRKQCPLHYRKKITAERLYFWYLTS